jgi:hypothetical protein
MVGQHLDLRCGRCQKSGEGARLVCTHYNYVLIKQTRTHTHAQAVSSTRVHGMQLLKLPSRVNYAPANQMCSVTSYMQCRQRETGCFNCI